MACIMINVHNVEDVWKARGFSCGIWVDPPGQVWEDYSHDVDELFMMIEGSVELEVEGHRLSPKAGEEVFIPAGAKHTVRNLHTQESRWLYGYKC